MLLSRGQPKNVWRQRVRRRRGPGRPEGSPSHPGSCPSRSGRNWARPWPTGASCAGYRAASSSIGGHHTGARAITSGPSPMWLSHRVMHMASRVLTSSWAYQPKAHWPAPTPANRSSGGLTLTERARKHSPKSGMPRDCEPSHHMIRPAACLQHVGTATANNRH